MSTISDIFTIYKSHPIALYGLSTETERVIGELKGEYNVAGLLDGYRTDGSLYGFPIISFDDAIALGVKLIIVVARPGSCKAIAKRIGDSCKEKGIALFDVRGKDLCQENKVVYDFQNVKGYTFKQITDAMKEADVISFDLFDTLIVRNVLEQSDLFDILEVRLKNQNFYIENFKGKRIATEKELSREYAPTLTEIYDKILQNETDIRCSSDGLAKLEYELDFSTIKPRFDSIKMLNEAKMLGKKVCIVTDTYYRKEKIENILKENNIKDYDELFVSCEYKTGKQQALFDNVISHMGTGNILHIGDDELSDITSADKKGIKTFKIYSCAEMLDLMGGLGLLEHMKTLCDKIRLGMFVADIFNSPFQFENDKKNIKVNDVHSLAYSFCAPLIFDFTRWFGQTVEKKHIENILFCARDGFLIQKIFSEIYPEADTIYFLTSRIASIRAGVEDDDDLKYVDSMKFSGSEAAKLKVRFGIDIEKIGTEEINESSEGILKYSRAILKNARTKRENILKYINSLKLTKNNIAIFDFVSKGTTQMYLKKFVDNDIIGLYFLQLEPEFMRDKNLNIIPFYSEAEKEKSAIFDNYYILETILTSPKPSIDEFDADGNPIYAKETRKKEDVECILRAQDGILAYVKTLLKLCPKSELKINKEFSEKFLTLINNVEISDNDFLSLTVEDPFFNRMTDIKNVL